MKEIFVSMLIILLLAPLSHAQNLSLNSAIVDRYNGSMAISQEFTEEVKKQYDLDHSGYLDKNEISYMVMEKGLVLNFTPILNVYYVLNNFTMDGRKPLINVQDIQANISIPMPVNGTSYYNISFKFTFYLNGTSDHVIRLKFPNRSGYFSLTLPKNNNIIENTLLGARIKNNFIGGKFENSIYIKFREENYYWMNIFSISLLVISVGIFIFIARKLRGGRTKGLKLLIKSILRNFVALFIILTILFYIIWVAGPPPSVRIGGISTALMRFEIIKYYHLDRPWYDQYLNWWHLILTGGITKGVNWGSKPVDLKNAILISLTIFILSTIITYLISIFLAIRKKSSKTLDIYAAVFLGLYSIPTFYAALLVIHSFEGSPWLYTAMVAPHTPIDWALRIFIASLLLSLLTIARPYLIAKALANKEFSEPYIQTYRAIGVTPQKLRKVVRRSAVIPTVTDSVLNFGWFLTAQVFLEIIFEIQGVGYILFRGTVKGNPFQIQIAIIYFSIVMIAASIISDIIVYLMDPRVRK